MVRVTIEQKQVYKFAEIPFKSFGNMQDEVLYEELYFKMAEKYFGKGKTPLSASPKNLPEIRPPSHLDSSNTLPSFSSPYSIVIVFIVYLYSIVFHSCFFRKTPFSVYGN